MTVSRSCQNRLRIACWLLQLPDANPSPHHPANCVHPLPSAASPVCLLGVITAAAAAAAAGTPHSCVADAGLVDMSAHHILINDALINDNCTSETHFQDDT